MADNFRALMFQYPKQVTGVTILKHFEGLVKPQEAELPMVYLLKGWLSYADQTLEQFDSRIGDDSTYGPAWEAIGDNICKLLPSCSNRLDPATLYGVVIAAMLKAGIDTKGKAVWKPR